MVEEEGLLGLVGGYSIATAIMAGPWLVTVLTVVGVTLLSVNLSRFDAYITHVYQVSLITVGFLQFPATRYLADLIYRQDYRRIFPAFSYTLSVSLAITSALGGLWAFTTPGLDILEKLLAVSLMNIVTGQWVSLIFLVTVHAYRSILAAFVGGSLISLVAVDQYLGSNDDLSILLGYSLGQLVTLLWLTSVLMREYPAYQNFDLQALSWIKQSWQLSLAGGLFYLGVFADKFAYRYGSWLSDSSMVGRSIIPPWIIISQPYEFLSFLAQLTVIPALAVFYIRIETGFYEVYKAFYKGIDEGRTLDELKAIKNRLLDEMKNGAKVVFGVQAVITVLCLLIAPELLPNRILNEANTGLLRANLIAAYFSILLLLAVVLYLYFEFYREAFQVTALYALLNFTLSSFTLAWGEYHGWGAALAAFIGCCSGLTLLWNRVDDLLYQTFSKSPVEILPEKVNGVGRFGFQKEPVTFDADT